MDLRFRRESGLARASALAAPLRRTAQRPYGGRRSAPTEDGAAPQQADGVAPQRADGVGALRAAVSKPASSHRWTCVFGAKAGLLARARSQRRNGGRCRGATGGRRRGATGGRRRGATGGLCSAATGGPCRGATGGLCRGAASGSEQARLVP